MGGTKNGKVLTVLRLKMRGVAGYSTAGVEGLRAAVESLGIIEVKMSWLETGILAATCILLMVGGDGRTAMVPVSSI